ncbi:MAG: histone deacetylase [Bacteroidota bacterium]|nr:histone deacetylase [Bacteroidota bacterium]
MLKIAWSEIYAHPLPLGHRFPMLKYELLPQQLLYEGTITTENLFEPRLLNEAIILLTHCKLYWERLSSLKLTASEIRKTGFPHSKELIKRESYIMNGTVLAADYALKHGIAMNIAGGTHHAFTNHGEGFCLLNDIAISANYLLSKNQAKKILVIDLDVHQGNGTAEIFRNNSQVFTFSMHGEKNFPLHKELSDLDISLPDNINDKSYLKILRETLPALIDQVEPDFIFYLSGVDVLSTDKLGRLGLSREGCKERDKIVLKTCKSNNIPVAVSMGGGYSEKITDILEAHANTYRLAQHIYF